MTPSRLRRAAPLGALALAVTALAAPAHAAGGGGGGGGGAGGEIIYNSAGITLSGFPAATTTPITLTRDGAVIGNGSIKNAVPAGATAAVGNLNVPGLVAPEPATDCWTGFTPDMLPGDIIGIDAGGANATTVIVPDFAFARAAQEGADLVARGTTKTAAGAPLTSVTANLFSKLPKFSTGTKGKTLITGGISFAPGSSAFTARFAGLAPSDMALGLSSAATRIETLPGAAGAGAAAMTIGADNPAVAGPVPGCSAPLGRDAVTALSTKSINIANQSGAVTVSGVADPGVTSVSLNLGGQVFPATLAGGTWSATVNPAGLPDGALTAAARFTNATGTYHGETMQLVKDTVAPGAPTASVAAGSVPAGQRVSLSAEPGASVHYTTDGSNPTAASPTANDALVINRAQTVKAVAVDAAGNVSPVAAFDYGVNAPAAAPVALAPKSSAPSAPKLAVESLTVSRRVTLRRARKSGLQVTVFTPDGAKVVRIRLLRGTHRIDQVVSKVSSDGVVIINLPHSRKARRALKRGSYSVLVSTGTSAANLGATTVRRIAVR